MYCDKLITAQTLHKQKMCQKSTRVYLSMGYSIKCHSNRTNAIDAECCTTLSALTLFVEQLTPKKIPVVAIPRGIRFDTRHNNVD